MDARNVWASAEDSGFATGWNYNREANALTDRDVFRVFRDGAGSSNTYRIVSAKYWWLRSLYWNNYFLYVQGNGTIYGAPASNANMVRPLYFLKVLWVASGYKNIFIILRKEIQSHEYD